MPDKSREATPDTVATMNLVSHFDDRPVTLEVVLKHDGGEAWFTVSCPCGCDGGAVLVSLDQEALWLAAGLITAVERLSGVDHPRRTA
jgi:hypothetical protein